MDRITVPQQILRRGVVGERIDDQLSGPGRRGGMGDVEMNDLAPFVVHDDQNLEKSKGECGNDKEVYRGDAAGVVLEKSIPTLGGLSPGPGTVLPDGCRRGFQSQFG